MNEVLDFPVLAEPHQATDLAKIDLTAVAIAQYGDWRNDVKATKANLSTLVLDLSNAAKIKEARALRQRLIGDPLAAVRKVAAVIKSKMAQTSKAVGAELDAIEAAYKEADALILPQIEKREDELAVEKAERDRIEAERKRKHTDRIAALAGMVERAAGKTAADLATAIDTLEANYSTHPDVFEEFSQEAAETKARVIAALKSLQAKAALQEAQAAENERIRIANEAEQNRLALLGRIASQVTECFGQSAACIESRLNLLRKVAYAEGTPAEVLMAHDNAIKQIEQLLEAAKLREAAPPTTVGQHVREVFGDDHPVTQALVAGAEPVALQPQTAHSTTLRMGDFPPPSVAATAGPITMVEPPALAVSPGAPSNAIEFRKAGEAIDLLTLLRDLQSLTAHANEAFAKTKFVTQPKPGPEWWACLREGIANVQPRLEHAVEALEER